MGLSNKAVYDEEKKAPQGDESEQKNPSLADDLYKEVYFNIIDLNRKILGLLPNGPFTETF